MSRYNKLYRDSGDLIGSVTVSQYTHVCYDKGCWVGWALGWAWQPAGARAARAAGAQQALGRAGKHAGS